MLKLRSGKKGTKVLSLRLSKFQLGQVGQPFHPSTPRSKCSFITTRRGYRSCCVSFNLTSGRITWRSWNRALIFPIPDTAKQPWRFAVPDFFEVILQLQRGDDTP